MVELIDYRDKKITVDDLKINDKGRLILPGPGVIRGSQRREIGEMISQSNLIGPDGPVKVSTPFGDGTTGLSVEKNAHLIPEEYKIGAKPVPKVQEVKKKKEATNKITKLAEMTKVDIKKEMKEVRESAKVDVDSLLKKLKKNEVK